MKKNSTFKSEQRAVAQLAALGQGSAFKTRKGREAVSPVKFFIGKWWGIS